MQADIRLHCFAFAFILVLNVNLLRAEEPDVEGVRFFEAKIRPVLVEHCYECHSSKSETLRAGLLVDSKQGLIDGGDSGGAIVPGKPDESILLDSLHYEPFGYQMPPSGKLPDQVIADFKRWIEMGAPDPRTDAAAHTSKTEFDIDSRRSFWSFQVPLSSDTPRVKQADWPRQKLDFFILARLEEKGLQPTDEADRATLIRRAYFDLIGLPPSYEEIQQFVGDTDPDAYAKLIDRLLASAHYGERWARHWLDVVRYAEDNVNMGPLNGPYPNAYRYRDWVIKALNEDIPYNEFLRRQLATDFLENTDSSDLSALGLLGTSPQYHKELMLSQDALAGVFADEWEDRVDVVGRGLLGLTVACARCHDHKFDPISTKDYYALAGVFASIRQKDRPLISEAEIQVSQPARDEIATLQKQIKEHAERRKPLPEASDESKRLAGMISKAKARIADLRATVPNVDIPMAPAVSEEQPRIEPESETHQKITFYPDQPRDLPVFIRGNVTSPGKIVPRRFLEVLSEGEPQPFEMGSGRLDLANAIVSDKNPLTARVFVNRVWMHHFGEGLVDSPSNFGVTGSQPSHPKLLDDLAVRFMESGWSIKELHRQIMLSATYRQSTIPHDEKRSRQVDAANRLLSHFNRQRLDAEAYHDMLTVAGGNLDSRFGGPSGDIDSPDFRRRAIYAKISRQAISQFLQVYDFPDPTIHAERRAETTTALQQLFVMNSEFAQQQALRLASRVEGATIESKIRELHRLLFGREPTPAEMQLGQAYLQPKNAITRTEWEPAHFVGARAKASAAELGDTYSVELWFKNELPHDQRPVTGYFLSRGEETSTPSGGDHLGILGTHREGLAGRLIYFNGDRLRTTFTGRTTLETNQWNHLVFVRDRSEVRIYLNGNPEPEIAGLAEIDYDFKQSKLFVGGRNDQFANFQGQMSGVAVFDCVLSSEEINQHYQASGFAENQVQFAEHFTALLQADPQAAWPLFQYRHFPRTLTDESGHEHELTYEGEASFSQELTPWVLYCHALLCSNELLFVD